MDEPRGSMIDALRERIGWLAGIAALLAWCALLWAMFGDVL